MAFSTPTQAKNTAGPNTTGIVKLDQVVRQQLGFATDGANGGSVVFSLALSWDGGATWALAQAFLDPSSTTPTTYITTLTGAGKSGYLPNTLGATHAGFYRTDSDASTAAIMHGNTLNIIT